VVDALLVPQARSMRPLVVAEGAEVADPRALAAAAIAKFELSPPKPCR
jgi:hypothetical protein